MSKCRLSAPTYLRKTPTHGRSRESNKHTMKYILMMNAPSGPYQIFSWKKEAIQAHVDYMMRLNKQLTEAGEMLAGEALTEPDQAILVKADDNRLPITDGVFPESKEFLAGFWIVEVESKARALAIAAEVSCAPGPDGKPLKMAVEVREVMTSCHSDQ